VVAVLGTVVLVSIWVMVLHSSKSRWLV
jgi:hypothetical protein